MNIKYCSLTFCWHFYIKYVKICNIVKKIFLFVVTREKWCDARENERISNGVRSDSATYVCYVCETRVFCWYAMIQGSSTQPTIILRDEGGCVLSWRRIVLSADEMYDEHHGNAIRDGLKLVKARSPGAPFPLEFAYHPLSLSRDSLNLTDSDV